MADQLLEIEKAFSNLRMSTALAKDTDALVSDAIDWYTCVKKELSRDKIRRRPTLIKDAVGDYLYIAGCNLEEIVDSLPERCNQDLLSEVAAKHVSRLVAQHYPDLRDAMQRSVTLPSSQLTA